MAPQRQRKLSWPKKTELVGLEFLLQATQDCELYPQYTIALHAWFLQQIQSFDPELSAYLHDGESEKSFSITGLDGQFVSHRRSLQLKQGQTYRWQVHGFSKEAAAGLAAWLQEPPTELVIKTTPLTVQDIQIVLPATTYQALSKEPSDSNSFSLTFASPTSFRRKGHHLPLPWPRNVFHSYLRRWNHFSEQAVSQDEFLDWIDDHAIIQRHQMQSVKVAAGKRGSVTGFTGAIAYALTSQAKNHPNFHNLFFTLGRLAPYCGTGHKTTFGLGHTIAGWHLKETTLDVPPVQVLLAERIEELTILFREQRKRTGGDRAQNIAEKWATVLARREQGDSLLDIANDLDMPYETAKTYSKLARRSLKDKPN
ncbi:CRISPR-associated endoribonuclease Cas6 [Oscillatoria sp. CS-180]|uniref:CRISPR-associated endoribonuclease Cas6 n=1 Tax=Oscillatoria sp. CS-180 TaxID=3021720 RepID=UPI00232C6C5F|nr:CRISPR-associated endoribonuclease Cas6 [Oscillatoria sp. CS-180]MDB9524428.1 CRISPR-associated endoribonuclease Cas6 [Oscillatoria sp. CS-180]